MRRFFVGMHLIDLKIVEALHLHKDMHLCRCSSGVVSFCGSRNDDGASVGSRLWLSLVACQCHRQEFFDSVLSALVSFGDVRILLDSQSIPPVQFRGKYCVGGSKDCAFRRHSCSVEMDNARSGSLVVPDLC